MRRSRAVPRWSAAIAAWFVLAGGVVQAAVGQATRADTVPATILGHVVDSTGKAVDGAEVVLTRNSDRLVLGAGRSDAQGNVTLRNLPAGGPYTLLARRIGFGPASGTVSLRGGDTLRVDFEMPPVAVTLAPITVRARRSRYNMAARDLMPKVYRDALTSIAWLRRDMLGDPEWCSPLDTFGQAHVDRPRLKITDRLMLYGMQRDERLSAVTNRPWIDSVRFGNGFDLPRLPYVRHVYINGVRADVPGDPYRSPAHILRETPADRIVEMHYLDCWDTTMPIDMQYSIFIVLGPPTQRERDSLRRAVSPAVLRQRRQAWDSILHSLGLGDTAKSR